MRLFVRIRPEQAPVLDEARVRRALAEAFFVAAIQRDVESDALARTRFTGDFVEQATPLEMLERYMVSKEIPEDRARVMIDYARRIFAEVEG